MGAQFGNGATLVAVIPVRDGVLPLGADEAVAEANGLAIIVGTGTADAAEHLQGIARQVTAAELPAYGPNLAADAIDTMCSTEWPASASLLLPASPDGRDLAPLLAYRLAVPLLAGAVEVHAGGARLLREWGNMMEDVVVDGPFVATLQPGVRGAHPDPTLVTLINTITLKPGDHSVDPPVIEITPPDPTTMDLAEAPRIVGGGAGLGSAEAMTELGRVSDALGCSLGATRVVTDWGWVPFDRQIGTTGVAVHPDLYLAFGISGAVQHTAGLGNPTHIIAVNIDGSCPMMSMADLAIVTDGPALVTELARRLDESTPVGPTNLGTGPDHGGTGHTSRRPSAEKGAQFGEGVEIS